MRFVHRVGRYDDDEIWLPFIKHVLIFSQYISLFLSAIHMFVNNVKYRYWERLTEHVERRMEVAAAESEVR